VKELVEYIATALVDDADAVRVQEVEKGGSTVIELVVAKEDVGKVVGKHGRTAKAIRTLLSVSSAKHGKRAGLEIIE